MSANANRNLAVGGILLLLAVVLLLPWTRPPDLEARLHEFLEKGPGPGLWQVNTLNGTREWLIGPHPDEPGCVLVSEVRAPGLAAPVEVMARRNLALRFVPGHEELFQKNYRFLGGAETDEGRIRAVWLPRHAWEGETRRALVVDAETLEVWGLEDRSWMGNCVRCLTRLSDDDPGLVPPTSPGEGHCRGRRSDRGPPDLGKLASRVPYTLLAPSYLPPGFQLVSGHYTRWKRTPSTDDPEPPPIRLAILYYTDGLANIDLVVALPEDLDDFEARVIAMGSDEVDPEVCPRLPQPSDPDTSGEIVIRRRRDRCRTVLRMDGYYGVSVQLLGRNEIPEDEYELVIRSVDRVEPVLPRSPR